MDEKNLVHGDEPEKEVSRNETPDLPKTENSETKNKVSYENNDNWKFDAEAPTLSDDLFEGDSGNVSNPGNYYYQPQQTPAADDKNNVVIKKSVLIGIPAGIIAAVLVAVLVFLGVRYYTTPKTGEDNLTPASVIMTVGDQKVSMGMFEYYYASIVNYYEQYAAYGYYTLDTSADYATQYTTDEDGNEISWQDFFKNESLEEIQNITANYKLGLDNGVTLLESQQKTIDEQIETLKTSASGEGISLNEYLSDNFGPHCDESTIRLMLEQYYIAANYKGMFKAETKVTDEEIDAYYSAHQKEIDQISFSYIAIPYDTSSEDGKAQSDNLIKDYESKITDRDSLVDLVPTVYAEYIEKDKVSIMDSDPSVSEEDAVKSATENYLNNLDYTITSSTSPFSEDVTNWLFSKDTKIGSVNHYIDEESSYAYIILKTEESTLDNSETYSVRHILITPESDDETSDGSEEATYTDEQWKAAEDKANEILEEYNSGDKTEYSFALLAEKYTADTASTSTGSSGMFGGLYEATALGTMVSEFEGWATDDSRKYGDVEIVKSDFGYHIMFFVNDCESYKANIISSVISEKLEEQADSVEAERKEKNIENAIELFKENRSELSSKSNSSSGKDNSEE